MNWVKSLIIAFSMYSKIPMPHLNLEEKDMRYVMGFFPLVGLVLGACQFIWYKLSAFLGVPNVSRALIFLVLPVIVTGGIHVDGYMDTSDAIHSYGDREKNFRYYRIPISGHLRLSACWYTVRFILRHFSGWQIREKNRHFCFLRAYFICHGYSADLRRSISVVQEKTGCCIHLPV